MPTVKQYVVYGDNNQLGLAIARAQNLGGGAMVHREVSWYVNQEVKKNPNIQVSEWKLWRIKVSRVVRYVMTPIKPAQLSLYELLEPAYWSSLLRHRFKNVRAQILEIPKDARVVSLSGAVKKVPLEQSLQEYGIHWRIRTIEVGTYG